jgi:hypothetical protein
MRLLREALLTWLVFSAGAAVLLFGIITAL